MLGPTVLVFDVNETLLDLGSLHTPEVRDALAGLRDAGFATAALTNSTSTSRAIS